MTAKALPRMDEDTRLEPILANLSQGFIAGMGSEWGTSEKTGEGLRAEMVDELAHKHFPMCMRNLHENLKRNHHLKHFGRLQYGLFLKVGSMCHRKKASYNFCTQVLGLSVEEALTFWRRSFSGFTDDQFNKHYKYNIRHSYGLEGRRANYPAKRYALRGNRRRHMLTCGQLPANFNARPTRYLGFSWLSLSPLLSKQSSNGIIVDVFSSGADGG